MGRKREDDKKVNITLRMKKSLVVRLKSVKLYNVLVENLVERYFNDVDSKSKEK